MNERERLIELLYNIPPMNINVGGRQIGKLLMTMQHIADHLLANGVIVPPCKVGDKVYSIKRTYSKCRLDSYWDEIRCDGCELECDAHVTYNIQDERVTAIEWNGRCFGVKTNKYSPTPKSIGEFNYGVFLTKEEAEKALAERGRQ